MVVTLQRLGFIYHSFLMYFHCLSNMVIHSLSLTAFLGGLVPNLSFLVQ